jgi:hypothetical protein
MTTTRILIAGILGGLAMFIWTSIAHMALPLGEAGLRELPNEAVVMAALQTNLGDKAALYLFPGLGVGKNPTREQRHEAMKNIGKRMADNPAGFLMYHPAGSRPLSMTKYLSIEFGTELLEAILAVFLLAQTRIASFGGRVGFVFVVGILAAFATNVSYWNWYGFPGIYTASYMLIQIIGFLCIGLVAALVLRKIPPEPAY